MSKFKGKVGIAAVIGVIAIVAVMYLLIVLPLDKQLTAGAKQDVTRAAEAVPTRVRYHAYDLVAVAKHAANHSSFAQAIGAEAKRQEVYNAIQAYDGKLKTQRRKSDFFGVVDEQGKIIARDLNIQDMHGEKLPYEAVTHALAGRATGDVWVMKNRLLRAAVAPIEVGGVIKGAVVVGYDITDAEAKTEAKQFGAQVVYFSGGAVRASSFPKAGAEVKAVNANILGASGEGPKAVKAGKSSAAFQVEIDGKVYLAVAGPLPAPVTVQGANAKGAPQKKMSAATKGGGFVVLASLTDRTAQVRTTRWALVGFMAIFMLFVLLVMWVVAKHFVDAQDKLELGVSEVISGNMDYTFDALEEFEGLANALNVMLARLLGRPEPGEEEDDQSWRPDVLTIGELSSPSAEEGPLASEPEESYLAELYEQYIAARKGAQLSVEGLTLPVFSQKVKANEAMLRAKHECSIVRFKVSSAGGQVTLIPLRLG
ncbi:MAG: hypothetical protein CSA65_00820 [Proteobacteria bacterium]|nr:MAG: hypothetical protein CSB49_07890 [Pseudomonadota bacterium]PIE19835.1 MAG: hypothetical protein CSA65_00820 [Pseudomonadota bacterium]